VVLLGARTRLTDAWQEKARASAGCLVQFRALCAQTVHSITNWLG
jgi:hypothetical protein